MIENLQETLNLTQNESKIYAALVEGVEPVPTTLGTATGLPRTRVYEVLSSLSAKNLVEKRGRGGYRMIPPNESIPNIVEQLEKEHQRKKGSIKEIGNYLHKMWNDKIQADLAPGVEIYSIENSESLFLSDISSVSNRVWIAAADNSSSIDMKKSGMALSTVYKKGMDIRYLTASEELMQRISSRLAKFPPFEALNIRYQFNSNLHSSFVIIDSMMYLFFFGSETKLEATTLRTSSAQLLKSFEWMFITLWEKMDE